MPLALRCASRVDEVEEGVVDGVVEVVGTGTQLRSKRKVPAAALDTTLSFLAGGSIRAANQKPLDKVLELEQAADQVLQHSRS